VKTEVAVIGAGAIGLAVALEVRRIGVDDVVVLDANPAPGQGSTSRANGGVRAQFSTVINITFSRFTIERLAELDRATDGLVDLRRIGYLFMTGTPDGESRLRTSFELQRSRGIAVEWLDAEGELRHAPFVRHEGLRAGTFCATDGLIDPHGVAMALYREGRRLGVRYLLGERVNAITCEATSVHVHTDRRDIDATYAVNAAGPSAAAVATMAGVALPVECFRRNLACTQAVVGFPGVIPMCVDIDTLVLLRREGAGFLIGFADPADSPTTETSFDPAFLDALAQRVGNRFPFLESIPMDERKCWAGLYPETADHHAIIDGAPNAPRLIHCAGFGGHGIMHSLAAGRAVAELVRDGACSTFDLRPLRLSRFAEQGLTIETAVL
jgi:sarcosine oxidase subunit beta